MVVRLQELVVQHLVAQAVVALELRHVDPDVAEPHRGRCAGTGHSDVTGDAPGRDSTRCSLPARISSTPTVSTDREASTRYTTVRLGGQRLDEREGQIDRIVRREQDPDQLPIEKGPHAHDQQHRHRQRAPRVVTHTKEQFRMGDHATRRNDEVNLRFLSATKRWISAASPSRTAGHARSSSRRRPSASCAAEQPGTRRRHRTGRGGRGASASTRSCRGGRRARP